MNKKNYFVLSFILMVSFSAGIFVQFPASDQTALSAESVSFWQTFWSGCKSDLLITIISFILALAVWSAPFVILLITGQVFTLGFSAAYLLSVHPQGLSILCAVLLPRCLMKLPVYMALIHLSLRSAKLRMKHNRKTPNYFPYAVCALLLMLSSLLEAVLHLLIVSP